MKRKTKPRKQSTPRLSHAHYELADVSDIADFIKRHTSNMWCKLDLDFSPGTLVRTLFDLGRLYERQHNSPPLLVP